MAWQIKYADSVLKQLKKLDKQTTRQILDYMASSVAPLDDPKSQGKALTGELGTFWRYRVGNYRILCHIENSLVTVFVVKVAHRSTVYDDQKKIAGKAAREVESLIQQETRSDQDG